MNRKALYPTKVAAGSAVELMTDFCLNGGHGGTYCDLELSEAVDALYAAGYGSNADYIPHMTDAQFFEGVTAIDPHNFPTLAAEGIIHPDDVSGFLFDSGIGNLVRNNRKTTEVAQHLNLTPAEYTDLYSTYNTSFASDEKFIQALELQARVRTSRAEVPAIVHEILRGNVKYEDAESIGFNRCAARGPAPYALSMALVEIRRRKASFTLEHIRSAYEEASVDAQPHTEEDASWESRSIAARLDIMMETDGATALKVKYPIFVNKALGTNHEIYAKGDNLKNVLIYVDQLFAATNCTKELMPKLRDIAVFQEFNVDPVMVIREYTKRADVPHIMAIHEGAAPALTDGWL